MAKFTSEGEIICILRTIDPQRCFCQKEQQQRIKTALHTTCAESDIMKYFGTTSLDFMGSTISLLLEDNNTV